MSKVYEFYLAFKEETDAMWKDHVAVMDESESTCLEDFWEFVAELKNDNSKTITLLEGLEDEDC